MASTCQSSILIGKIQTEYPRYYGSCRESNYHEITVEENSVIVFSDNYGRHLGTAIAHSGTVRLKDLNFIQPKIQLGNWTFL